MRIYPFAAVIGHPAGSLCRKAFMNNKPPAPGIRLRDFSAAIPAKNHSWERRPILPENRRKMQLFACFEQKKRTSENEKNVLACFCLLSASLSLMRTPFTAGGFTFGSPGFHVERNGGEGRDCLQKVYQDRSVMRFSLETAFFASQKNN